MKTHKILDEKSNPELAKAQQAVSDATMLLLEAIASLEGVMYDSLYQKAFDEGVEWVREEFRRVTEANQVEPEPTKPSGLTEVEKITDQRVFECIVTNPGWRSSDITNKIIALPVKPALTERNVRFSINRLKNAGKIETKAGRWYSTSRKPSNEKFQVMTYLEDGSKYLTADVLR